MESNENITIHRMLYVNITWKIDDNRDANQIKTKQPAFHEKDVSSPGGEVGG